MRIELDVDAEADLDALEGALLAARASELSQIKRRGARHSFGYGSESARETMTDEVDHHERRWAMLDRLIGALGEARGRGG